MGSPETREEVTAVIVLRFEEFFQAEHVRLARAMYLLTGSAAEADELTQEAMVRVTSGGTGSDRWAPRRDTCTGPP